MALTVGDLRNPSNVKWLLEHFPGDEKILFPRQEAKKRAQNKEKRHRITFTADEVTYREFHVERERILRVFGEQPVFFAVWLCEVLKSWNEELLRGWLEARNGPEDTERS